MAAFTYQLMYWGWVRLETDEVKEGKNGEFVLSILSLGDWKLGGCGSRGLGS